MAVTFGDIAPWLDNWPIRRQLWNPGSKVSGNELDLVPLNRSLTVQWRDTSTGDVAIAYTEFQSGTPISIVNQARGVVEVALSGDQWNAISSDRLYVCEIIAYGFLYDSFPFNTGMPNQGFELLSGAEVYGAPREILELISRIPGAVSEISVPLAGWSLDVRGYWTRAIAKTQAVYGLFINDQHARQVDYVDLALGCDRQFARVAGDETDTLYYKGPENLADPFTYVETAHNRYVLRCLQEATAEFERKTGSYFSQRRIYREQYRGTYRRSQLSTRCTPVAVDRFFRLDCYSFARSLVRRYLEGAVWEHPEAPLATPNRLFVDSQTGVITVTEGFWDWMDWGNDTVSGRGLRGPGYFTPGDVAIELTYTAGYAYIPTDVSEAVGNMAAIRQLVFWERAISQGMNSLSIGCVNMSFADSKRYIDPWQQSAEEIIGSYQKIEIEAF